MAQLFPFYRQGATATGMRTSSRQPCQIHLPYTGYCCPERLLCKSSTEKRSEINVREQFVIRMLRCGGEIENGDFDKRKNANV